MKLNLKFLKETAGKAAYNGLTRLRAWWRIVNQNFIDIEEAHNDLEDALTAEISARGNADTALQRNIDEEAAARGNADTALQRNIDEEAAARANEDLFLNSKIADEVAARQEVSLTVQVLDTKITQHSGKKATESELGHVTIDNHNIIEDNEEYGYQITSGSLSGAAVPSYSAAARAIAWLASKMYSIKSELEDADSGLSQSIQSEARSRLNEDTALNSRATALETKAHTHDNKGVLDGITGEDIAFWNGIKNQVTKEELERAIDNLVDEIEHTYEKADNAEAFKAYMRNIAYGAVNQFRDVYTAMGIAAYDGGYFETEYEGRRLNGGSFSDTAIENTVDGGDYSPRKAYIPKITLATKEQVRALFNKEEV